MWEKRNSWEKVLNFDIASFINSLYIIGANNDANMLLESFIIDVISLKRGVVILIT